MKILSFVVFVATNDKDKPEEVRHLIGEALEGTTYFIDCPFEVREGPTRSMTLPNPKALSEWISWHCEEEKCP
jgi:hypothetical protein